MHCFSFFAVVGRMDLIHSMALCRSSKPIVNYIGKDISGILEDIGPLSCMQIYVTYVLIFASHLSLDIPNNCQLSHRDCNIVHIHQPSNAPCTPVFSPCCGLCIECIELRIYLVCSLLFPPLISFSWSIYSPRNFTEHIKRRNFTEHIKRCTLLFGVRGIWFNS
jgi:hypothetical protein